MHKGHIKIIKTILKEEIVDKVFIIPTNDYWDKKIYLSLEERTELIKLSLKGKIRKDKYLVEEDLSKHPYTYLLFRDLKKLYPIDEFYLIMGGDNVVGFKRWKHYKELLQYGFIVVDRNIDNIEEIIKNVGPKEYYLLDIKGIGDISSTYIRENLDDYEKIKKMINQKEYEYVYDRLKK